METIQNILAMLPEIIGAVLAIIGGAATIAALTPTQKDDAFISKIQGYVKKASDLLGMNVLNAKNK